MEKIAEIKAWLKAARMTRQELAEKIGVSKGTVDNWLCGTHPIPHAKSLLIDTMMQPAPPPPAVNILDEVQVITIKLTRAEYALVRAAAEEAGKTVEQWARQKILEAARRGKAP